MYEEILKIPNYIVYDWRTTQLRYFRLASDGYQEQHISPDNPQIWIPELNLGLGLRTEAFRGIVQPWLRWCDEMGNFFPTPTEIANATAELAQAQAADAQAQLEPFSRFWIHVLKLRSVTPFHRSQSHCI